MTLTQMKSCLKPFVLLLALPLAASTVRIIQTNSAGDNVHIIDPATNKVVGEITGIESRCVRRPRWKPLLHQ